MDIDYYNCKQSHGIRVDSRMRTVQFWNRPVNLSSILYLEIRVLTIKIRCLIDELDHDEIRAGRLNFWLSE